MSIDIDRGPIVASFRVEVNALRPKWFAAVMMGGLLAADFAVAQEKLPAPDNTKVDQRDRSKTQPTADQAKNSAEDRETMQKIRKAVMDDKSLSTYAHNVKIISQEGKVTLKGPVRSAEEKNTIEKLATDVAGAGNVTNEITIKPSK